MDSISSDNVGNMGNVFSDNPPSLFGVSSRTFILMIIVVVVAWILTRRVETFQTIEMAIGGGKSIVTEGEYIQDVKNMAAYVGPYIGEIYLHLRSKYFSEHKKGAMFQPGGIDDPTLADPLLPIARTQIKSWIDSNKLRFKTKYSDVFLQKMVPLWDLSYEQKQNGIIEVTYTQNGKKSVYVV